MTGPGEKIRLYVEDDLYSGASLNLNPGQVHYLLNVMRRVIGDRLAVFNGRDGEWVATITRIGRRSGMLTATMPGQPQRKPPDLWLLFAPIKKARTDFIVEKATELGVASIQAVLTRNTNSGRIRLDRLRAHSIEAAEQCGETFVPELVEPAKLSSIIQHWDPARRILFCDETRAALPARDALSQASRGPWAILIGPEGGFTLEESVQLRSLPFVTATTLGPRVLRADTAVVAAITLWQVALGDW